MKGVDFELKVMISVLFKLKYPKLVLEWKNEIRDAEIMHYVCGWEVSEKGRAKIGSESVLVCWDGKMKMK